MKMDIRQNIDVRRCNAYSGIAYLYAAISVKDRPVFATSIDGAADGTVPDAEKGGIIVFSREMDSAFLSEDRLVNWVRQRFSTFKYKDSSEVAVDKGVQEHVHAGWTVGHFFKGNYIGGNGEAYSEDSVSVEIIGVADDALIKTAEELCRVFTGETVLVKMYSERNRMFFVKGE